MSLRLTSEAFANNEAIPKRFTADGEDLSPPLAWSGAPQGVKEYALICDDPDAPTDQPWVHWVLYKIPPDTTSLPGGLGKHAILEKPSGARQGKNSWPKGQTIGYRGPAPPPGHGTHHYHFKLRALDTELDLAPGADKDQLLAAMKGHILASAELVGTYSRPKAQ